ncbi:MAG: class I SAM-dependent methyltransferase [Bacteroidetes bacterium]|nr:class I SAM-dependent methyltransferase [Bacteroidota bacterium]MBU2584385.1 class I SAM-dependent methyltransferase [Bacteroidota bacterium]
MHYDPVKDIFASFIRKRPLFRKVFFKILDVVFLRSWYVRREIRLAVKELGKKDLSVYDAGTGFGQYSYFIATKFPQSKIRAIDVKEEYIADCKEFFSSQKLNHVSFNIEDLTKIEHTEKFDLIICVDVMEHIEDDVKVFKNFFTALKPNGIVIINTPSVFGGSDVHSHEEESFIGEHFRTGYSKEDFTQKLESVGFKMRKLNYTYGFWGDKAWRLGIKIPILLANFSKLLILILPIYYLITFPFTLILMFLDFKSDVEFGTGIIVSARKT